MHTVHRETRPCRLTAAFSACVAFSAMLLLGSCAASLNLTANADGSASLTVDARIPDAVASRLGSYRSAGQAPGQASAPLFDPEAIRGGASAMGLTALTMETPSPNRFKGSFSIRSLAAVAGDAKLSKAGVFRMEKSGGETTLSFLLSRDNAEALPGLFPGMDPYILEALSPPALDPYPVLGAEYREMLAALLGETATREIDTASVQVRVRTPGAITRSSGGQAGDRAFTADLKMMELLVLEKPVEFSVSWR